MLGFWCRETSGVLTPSSTPNLWKSPLSPDVLELGEHPFLPVPPTASKMVSAGSESLPGLSPVHRGGIWGFLDPHCPAPVRMPGAQSSLGCGGAVGTPHSLRLFPALSPLWRNRGPLGGIGESLSFHHMGLICSQMNLPSSSSLDSEMKFNFSPREDIKHQGVQSPRGSVTRGSQQSDLSVFPFLGLRQRPSL